MSNFKVSLDVVWKASINIGGTWGT